MTKKEMESDLCQSIIWMIFSNDWKNECRLIINAIKEMKNIKSTRIYKKKYKQIKDFIIKCMKQDILTNRYDEFMEYCDEL